MEQQKDILQLLNLMVYPALCVQNGSISAANQEALHMGVCVGEPIVPLLSTGKQEYTEFTDGCLHLTLKLAGSHWGAVVSRVNDTDVFVLDQEPEPSQLQAMALAAQELRGPLSNIMTIVDDLLPLPALTEDPNGSAIASRINRGLYQMLRIVGNMSDAYRYTQENDPQLEYRDICSIWKEFWNHNAELVSHADITLAYTGPGESIHCLIDTEKLERAASNMLSNAIKFTPKGGNIDVRLTRRGMMLYLTVQNNSNDIPESLRGNVFSRYLRHPGIEDSRFGIGLGMVLIRSAATLHGGTVLMEQVPNEGTRITMTMQIRQDASGLLRSPIFHVDYAGERDHKLIELSETLPAELYRK